MPMTSTEHTVLTRSQWREREQAHAERVDQLTLAHRERVSGQIPHPVEDFLFTYYSLPVSYTHLTLPTTERV